MNIIEKIKGDVYLDNSKIDMSIRSFIDYEASLNFRSYSSIKRTSRKLIGKGRLIPLYISKKMMLIPFYDIKSNDAICINYYSIKGIIVHTKYTNIVFSDNTTRSFYVSSYKMNNLINKAKIIDEYITKID